ncbi:phenylalanine--tRNA ligase subunit beta [Candidatus Woesearchaeota archaeon]|nr:phenylalanine--tRNA ligase subunit beta [Candidatus Woesearchaeota archaeon]
MPTVTLNRKVFENLVGKKISDNELKDRISMIGTDLESLDKNEIVVEIFPNRPDMLSEQGFGRALSSFMDIKTGLKRFEVKPSGDKVIIDKSVKNIRPYTTCAIVKGLKFTDEKIRELIQIQEKLDVTFCRKRKKAAIGIYPFEKIKTPIRYLALKPEDIKFIPLESKEIMNANQILIKHPTGRKYGHLLEGLKLYPVFIDANNEVLSVPPIINSDNTGRITENTTDVFIECSGFDFKVLNDLLNIIVTALEEMGGKIYSMELVYPEKKRTTPILEPRKMKIKTSYVNKILGLDLKEKEIKKLLERMGFGYNKENVLIPPYRSDILHEIDLVEDISIAYGYENLKPEIPNIATIGVEDGFSKFKNKISNILVGLKLLETNTYHISNKQDQANKMELNIKPIELENALTIEYDVMRSWMVPSLLGVLSTNKHNEYSQNLFESGIVFKKGGSETGVEEFTRLAVVTTHKDTNFTEVKQILDYLLNGVGLKAEIQDTEHPSFIPGRVGRVSVNGKNVAYIGELSPKVLSNWGIEMPVSCFELNLTELYKLIEK